MMSVVPVTAPRYQLRQSVTHLKYNHSVYQGSIGGVVLDRGRKRSVVALGESDSPLGDGDDGQSPSSATSSSSHEDASAPSIQERSFRETIMAVYSSVFWSIKKNIHVLLCVYLITEGLHFLTNRIFHRMTNEFAMSLLGIPREVIGNAWWLSQNLGPEMTAASEYQVLTGLVFLVAFPVSVLIKAIQSIYIYEVLFSDGHDVRSLRTGLAWCKDRWPHVRSVIARVIPVEFLVSLVVIPLQFASLLVFSLPFTLPIIMSVHVALPVAIQEEKRGWDAIKESRALMKPILWQAAIPFVSIIVCQRLIDICQGKLIASLPQRFYYELLEVPLGIVSLGFGVSLIVALARQVLPFTLYKLTHD